MKIEEIANNNNIVFIISLVSLVFGLIGCIGIIYTIKSYIAQKRTEHAYEEILSKANQDWEGKYTADEIKSLNKQLHELSAQINNEIPKKAYMVLLEHKEEVLRSELQTLFSEYKRVEKEMKEINLNGKLSPEIRALISNEINKRTGKHEANNKLLVLIAAMLFVSIPSIYEAFYRISDYIIWISGAHITVSLLSFYIICLASCTILFCSLKFPKTYLWVIRNKKKSVIVIFALFSLWIAICYLLIYDIFLTGMVIQLLFGSISILDFAYAFCIFRKLLS